MSLLDVTTYKEQGIELHERIVNDVYATAKSIILVPLPDQLLLTQKQFDDLTRLNNMQSMFHSKDMLYRTPHNVMEVHVKDRSKLTFEEAHQLSEKEFEKYEDATENEDV